MEGQKKTGGKFQNCVLSEGQKKLNDTQTEKVPEGTKVWQGVCRTQEHCWEW